MNMRKLLLAACSVGALLTGLTDANAQIITGNTGVNTSDGRVGGILGGTSAANATTTQVSVANLTITLPPSGQYTYVCGIHALVQTNGTGAASTATWTAAGLPNGVGTFVLSEEANSSAYTPPIQVEQNYSPCVRVAPNTTISFTPSATLASAYVNVQIGGYLANN